MPSTNKTRYLSLNQYIGTDKLKRIDYNADMLNIDNGVKSLLNNITFRNGILTATKVDGNSIKVGESDKLITESKFQELLNARRATLDSIWEGV